MTNRSILHPSFTNDDKRQPAKRPFGLSAKGNCDETPIGHPLPDRHGFLAERMRRRLDAGIADCGKTNRQQCCLPHRQCLSGQHLQKHHKYLLVNAFRCTANTSMQKGRFYIAKGQEWKPETSPLKNHPRHNMTLYVSSAFQNTRVHLQPDRESESGNPQPDMRAYPTSHADDGISRSDIIRLSASCPQALSCHSPPRLPQTDKQADRQSGNAE